MLIDAVYIPKPFAPPNRQREPFKSLWRRLWLAKFLVILAENPSEMFR